MYKNTRKVGGNYEAFAAGYLRDKGYEILEMNFKVGLGSEIDIISKDGNTIVFVEVKYRNSEYSGHPLDSVNPAKQKKICEAARRYIYKNRLSEYASYRFDVIGILKDEIWHIENAFHYIGR